jgi:nucleoside 2-deoxyribosyltransferase
MNIPFKKIAIVGSTRYEKDMLYYAASLHQNGSAVRMPNFDHREKTELETAANNRDNIIWADEVHLFWDRVSMGTVFDIGMAFALNKKLVIVLLEERTFVNLFRQIEEVTK